MGDWETRVLRSLLFAPGNEPRKLEKVGAFGSDAVVLDLEDAVADAEKDAARDIMAEVDRLEQWVRELLSYSKPVAGKLGAIDPAPILRRCIGEFEREGFIRGVDGDRVKFHFQPLTLNLHVTRGITVDDVLWTCRRLAQLQLPAPSRNGRIRGYPRPAQLHHARGGAAGAA